ncbi:MAG: PaeR7I family type II restriction endonuclease [Thermoanaerobaculia bacterium]
MDGFCKLIQEALADNGVSGTTAFSNKRLEIPGFYRPTKKWDYLLFRSGVLLAAIEFKSQRGPSFGNNLNNRAEEAVGVASDTHNACREHAFGRSAPLPWLGWFMLVEDCPELRSPVAVSEPPTTPFRALPGYTARKGPNPDPGTRWPQR